MSVSALNRHTVIQSRCDKSVEVTGNATDGQQHLPSLGHIEKIFVKKGDCLAKDQPIVAINVMKMEFVIRAPFDGIVSTVCCATGNSVMKNTCSRHSNLMFDTKEGLSEPQK
uniref:Lipoyl-binding domain-containing protein n=1 Tax=Globodera rostochiensis TaxID=31243 RepID=A0A914I9S3_GLORO